MQWSEDSMKHIMEAVKGGMLCLNAMSKSYGISRATQRVKISGRIVYGTKSGSTPNLSDKDEKE